MDKKVIAITLYRRPDYTQVLFDALKKCYGIEDYMIFVSCDYDERFHEGCTKSLRIAEAFRDTFHSNTIISQNIPKLGIDLNKLYILPLAYEQSDYVIFLEDDTIPSPDALRYFEWGQHFKDNPDIIAICGYERYGDIPFHNLVLEHQAHAAFKLVNKFSSWGWALWKDRYERIYGMDGSNYIPFVDAPNGRFDWHLFWQFKGLQGCIFPRLPRIQSIGGEMGEHTPNAQWHKDNEYNPLGAWCQEMPDTDQWQLVSADWDTAMKELSE
jgi:hypothetical protein